MKRIAPLLIFLMLCPSIAIADHTYSYRSCTDEAAIGRKLQLNRLSIQYNMLIESGNCTGAREFARAYIPETLHKEGPTCPLRISGVILNAYLASELGAIERTGCKNRSRIDSEAAIKRYNRLISDNDYNRASVFALSFLPTLTFNSNGRPLNIETGEENELWEHKKITRTFVREVTETYLLEYENGQSVETTSEHPFYIEGKGWVPVKNLRIGDYSRTRNGSLKLINITVRKYDDPIEVYNLEVEGRHNYIVTESGILVHNAGEYTHNKILTISYESLPRNQYGARLFGTTRPDYNWQYEIKSNPDGTYRVEMKTFEVTTQVVVNTDIEFSDISDFRKYYRPDGNYTLRDIDPRFATRDGTIYHERLHQAQMDREIENAKPHIERSINRIVASSPEEAQRFANNILYGFQDQIQQNMHWPPAHQNIFMQEWIYYHQEYEKFLQRGGR